MKLHSWLLLFVFSFAGVISSSAQWITDYQAALQKAQAEDKAVLIFFTGSDWCPPCMRLKSEVFDKSEFKQFAQENLILLEIDFPRKKAQTAAIRSANDKLASQFGIEGYPTVFLVDKNGNRLVKTGYAPGGPKNYIANLKKAPGFNAKAPSASPKSATPPAAAKKQETPAYAIAPLVIKYDDLALKGISGGRTRIALINNQSLAVGEKGKVKVADKTMEIQVKEIREDSVIVQINGESETRELKLKDTSVSGN